jgi:hypothetical protein
MRESGVRWDALRRSTSPPDYSAAAAAVYKAYTSAGLEPPKEIAWEQGPLGLVNSWSKRRHTAGDSVRAHMVDAVRRRAEAATDRAISLPVRVAFAGTPGLARAPEFCAGIDEAVWRLSERVVPRLRLRIFDFLPGSGRRPGFAASSFSLLSAPWLGMLECMHDVCGLVQHAGPAAGLWEIARHASWMVPYARVCWLMERPRLISTDANGRLHAPDGPALRYADGCKIYAWKGILLPAHLIEQRDRIDVRSIDLVTDPHIRRCMIDIMTPKRFVESGGAYRVAEDETGVLWRQRWRWEAWAAVEVVNGTPEPDGTYKHYFLQVPPTVRTPREGVAWSYGLSERHYRPIVRT